MKETKICVIGLGYVGLPLARLFSTKFETIGFDMNQRRVDALMAGHDATLPGIRSTIVVLLILSVGQMMNISFDRPYVMGNPQVQDYCDVLSTFVYRAGITNAQPARATAIGLFQSLVGLILIGTANFVTKRLGEEGIW